MPKASAGDGDQPTDGGGADVGELWWEDPVHTGTVSDEHNVNPLLVRLRYLEEKMQEVERGNRARFRGQELDNLAFTVPADVKAKILDGKCINLAKLVKKPLGSDDEETETILEMDDKGHPVLKKVKQKHGQLSISQWTSAFLTYISVYVETHPDALQGLLAYTELIRGAARDHAGDKWAKYDYRFRLNMESDPTRPWGVIDNQLWIPLFCTNPSAQPMDKQAAKASTSSSSSTTKGQSEKKTCYYFNKKSGCNRASCQYLHKCSRCSSRDHGVASCSQKSAHNVSGGASGESGNKDNPFRGSSKPASK